MKHFGAQLAGLNNQVDGGEDSLLLVGADDTLVIMTPNVTGGQTLDGSLAGLVINSANGSTHVLGADGREIAISSLTTAVNTALHLPISNAAGTAFVDSGISQSAVGDGSNIEINGNVNVTGTLQVQGNTTQIESTEVVINDRFLHLGNTAAASTTTDLTGGIVVETDNDGSCTRYYGLYTSTCHSKICPCSCKTCIACVGRYLPCICWPVIS